MQQDLAFNHKSLEEALKNKQNDKRKKGITGKVDLINNGVNNLANYVAGKSISEEQIKQLMNNLNMISKNILEIFQKENQSADLNDMGYQQQQILQNKLDEISGYQIASEFFIGAERQPFVTKHNDILVDMNSEAQQFLQKKINVPLNDKSGSDFLYQFQRSNRLFNDSIDNLLDGIKKEVDLKTIVSQRVKMEDDYYQQMQMNQQQMQENDDQVDNYIQEEMNPNMNMQDDEYNDDNMQQNDGDGEMLQNDNDQEEEHI